MSKKGGNNHKFECMCSFCNGVGYWYGKERKCMQGDKNYAWKGGLPSCIKCNKKLARRDAKRCQVCANRIYHSGENNINWKGGITPINEKERKKYKYKKWRIEVLKRDNFQCIWCGSKEDLEVDHIKPFAFYKELRTKISNGRTLCVKCHQKTFIFNGNQFLNKDSKGVIANASN